MDTLGMIGAVAMLVFCGWVIYMRVRGAQKLGDKFDGMTEEDAAAYRAERKRLIHERRERRRGARDE